MTNAGGSIVAPYAAAPSGYRLPSETHLGIVRLQVSDLARSLAYYEDIIGLRVRERTASRATLSAHGEDETLLVELNELPGATPVPSRGRLGLYHFAILLPDRASLARFLAHAYERGQRPGMSDHLVSEAIYLTDPDGLGIEVYADRPRDQWRMAGSSIAMATDPLDVEGLMQEARGIAWSGAPSGTRIGHVHLYVSDLTKSATFFHDGLGFDRIVLSFPGALFMSAGGYHHHLGTNTWAAHAPPAQEGDARLLEWTIHVPSPSDAENAGSSIEKAGFVVQRDGSSITAADPWGTRVRVTAGTD